MTHQSPCNVQLSAGPTLGVVSQNCVCRSGPPGYIKQQESPKLVLLWQETGLSTGQVWSKVDWASAGKVKGDCEDEAGGVLERRGSCARFRTFAAYCVRV